MCLPLAQSTWYRTAVGRPVPVLLSLPSIAQGSPDDITRFGRPDALSRRVGVDRLGPGRPADVAAWWRAWARREWR